MKNRFITLLSVFLLLISTGPANANPEEPCGFDRKRQWLLENDPEYAKTVLANEDRIRSFFKLRNGDDGSLLTVPIVVHIIHKGEDIGDGVNITDAQVLSAIDAMNKHYSNIASTKDYGDTNIRFCLAIRDPNGLAHSGITRESGILVPDYAENGITNENEAQVKALSWWPNTEYYNIWIVSEINGNDGGAGTQGYAYSPPDSPSPYDAIDGAVILYNAFGTTGNLKPYTNKSITATHEIGHGLNLLHPFEGLSCDEGDCAAEGDLVCDTPPHTNNDISCDVRECDGAEQVENYMDYAQQDCQDEFSPGQTARMRAALLTLRPTLIASDACAAMPPHSDFFAPSPVCTGEVPFTDLSNNGPTSWAWEFKMGDVALQSFDQNPTILYDTSGDYDVTLTATNSIGRGNTEIKKAYVKVYDPPPVACDVKTLNLATGGAIGIFNVTFNTINHDTLGAALDPGGIGYQDFTCEKLTRVVSGGRYDVFVTSGEATVNDEPVYENVRVYIDYNNNGLFEDGNELAFSSSDALTTHAGTVEIPSTAITHRVLRMRVVSDLSLDGSPLPLPGCDDQTYGQAEDYGLIIVPRGDVDADRDVDLTDAVLVLMALTGLPPEDLNNLDADVNGNGRLDMAEVIFIMQWLSDLR